MSSVFVVMASTGEYSDTRVWPVLVRASRQAADEAIEAMRAYLATVRAELTALCESTGVEEWEVLCPIGNEEHERLVTRWCAPFGQRDPELLREGGPALEAIECNVGEWPAATLLTLAREVE